MRKNCFPIIIVSLFIVSGISLVRPVRYKGIQSIPILSELKQKCGINKIGETILLKHFDENRYLFLDVDFQASPSPTCSGTTVHYTSAIASGNGPYTYSWHFGDGASSFAKDTSRVYSLLGCGSTIFSDTLIVQDASGARDTAIHLITINQMPDVQLKDDNIFASPPFSNCQNSPTATNPNYSLTLSNTSPNSDCISTFDIVYGDGNVQNGLTAADFPLTHVYKTLGEFDLTVIGHGKNGCSNSKTYKVLNHSDPGVGISGPPSTTGCGPIGFWFKLEKYERNSPGTKYTWDFGDDSPLITWEPPIRVDSIYHEFKETSCNKPGGQFVVKVTAFNGCFSKDAFVNGVKIYKKPKADFVTPSTTCVDRSTTFTNTTVESYNAGNCNRMTSYAWDFGDNTTSQLSSPSHIYRSPGTYLVTLIATGNCSSDTVVKSVCVTVAAAPSFTVSADTICILDSISTINNSTKGTCEGAGVKWDVQYDPAFCGTSASWRFGTGDTDTSLNPHFIFNTPGRYTVRLKILSACVAAPFTKTIFVKGPPKIAWSDIPNGCIPYTVCPKPTITECGSSLTGFLWVIDSGAGGTSQNPDPGCFNFTSVGTHTISLTVSSMCGTTTVSKTFTVDSNPQLTVPQAIAYCPGDTAGPFLFSSTTTASQIQWKIDKPEIGLSRTGAGNIDRFVVTNPSPFPVTAKIFVTATKNECNTTDSFTITVQGYIFPPVVTTPVTFCKDNLALPLSATALPGKFLVWYTAPTSGIGSINAPVPSTTASGTTTYYVSQRDSISGCESTRTAIVVNVYPLPSISNATLTDPKGCAASNGRITLAGLAPNTSYIVQFKKNNDSLTILTETSSDLGEIAITGLAAGTYSDIRIGLNGCVSNSVGPFILHEITPFKASALSNTPICDGDMLQLRALPTSLSATYHWTGPNGFVSSQQNPVIPDVTVFNAGTYYLTVTINGCSSIDSTTVSVSFHSVGGVTGPDTVVCSGQNSGTITLSQYAGSIIQWEFSMNNGASWNTIANTTSTLSFTNVQTNRWYRALVQNGSCPSTYSDTARITVVPPVSVLTISPDSVVTCSQDTIITFLAQPTYTGSESLQYSWYVDDLLVSNTNPFTYRFQKPGNPALPQTFVVKAIVATQYGCSTSATSTVVLYPSVKPAIKVLPSQVQYEPHTSFLFTDTISVTANKTWTWYLGDRLNQPQTGQQITHDYRGAGAYLVHLFVKDYSTGCINEDSVLVTIIGVPGYLYIPSAFSPTSNIPELRTFRLVSSGLESFHFKIIDKMRNTVFETHALNQDGSSYIFWDGTDARTGKPLLQGGYEWIVLEARFKNNTRWGGMSYRGEVPKYFGTVTIIR